MDPSYSFSNKNCKEDLFTSNLCYLIDQSVVIHIIIDTFKEK